MPSVITNQSTSLIVTDIINYNIDPLAFLMKELNGFVKDDSGNNVPLIVATPDQVTLNQIPAISVKQSDNRTQWMSVGAIRSRWYSTYEMIVWSKTVKGRWTIDTNLRARITSINKFRLAQNYVFMYLDTNTHPDDVNQFGTILYKDQVNLILIFDMLRPQPQ